MPSRNGKTRSKYDLKAVPEVRNLLVLPQQALMRAGPFNKERAIPGGH